MKPLHRTYVKVLMNLGIALLILMLIVFLLPKALLFFMPFVIGWIIALIANPLVVFFESKLRIKRKAGTAFVIIAVIALLVLAAYLIGVKVAREAVGLVNELPVMWDALEEDFRTIGKNMDILYSRFPKEVRSTITMINDCLRYAAFYRNGQIFPFRNEKIGRQKAHDDSNQHRRKIFGKIPHRFNRRRPCPAYQIPDETFHLFPDTGNRTSHLFRKTTV